MHVSIKFACLLAVAAAPWSWLAQTSAAAESLPAVAILVDCSRSMGENLIADSPGMKAVRASQPVTRLAATKEALQNTLDSLAADGNHRVAVWLFGHRLAWEADKQDPDLKEQTAYLEQTLGFDVLSTLLPGDDVELVRPLTVLEPKHVPEITVKTNLVQPWGEKPLYLGLVRTLDSFDRRSEASDRRVIVITDGGNQQTMCRYPTTKEQVLEAQQRHPLPVHVILLGGGPSISRQSEAELKQIALKSHGSFRKATTPQELATRLDEALADDQPAEPPAASAGMPLPTAAGFPIAAAATQAQAAPQTLEGTVVFFGEPVRRAKVKLAGARSEQTQTDAQGKFDFKKLPPGDYTVSVEAIVKNKFRSGKQTVAIGAGKGPVKVEISVE